MSRSATAPSIDELSFEQALKELETIVKALESGASDLERSIADYTRGTELKDHCLKKLADAKMKVEKIALDASGNPTLTPFDSEQA